MSRSGDYWIDWEMSHHADGSAQAFQLEQEKRRQADDETALRRARAEQARRDRLEQVQAEVDALKDARLDEEMAAEWERDHPGDI